ncbi:MAG: MotA/TolQ/ExbB proton channel family protein [Emcibacter sp.]|nr:MotA/TolQ/ExbB proton channel family protein [Emcibacter sp.]
MTRPQKYLTRITLFLIPVAILCVFLYPRLVGAFATNPGLNGLIGGVLLIGIIISIRQVTMLNPAVNWIEKFRKSESSEIPGDAPKIIAPMAAMMGKKNQKLSLSALSMRTILDGIAARMDEGREITRYFIGLLIFLGLLGTFWGLLGTIGSIKDTINNLTVGSNDISILFEDLKDGLAAPLGGMGTAFSSSLFGLAGSVVLGFIDLQAGQAQCRFFNDLEDWLSSVTTLSRGSSLTIEGGDATVPAYVSALLEQSADSLENLHNVIARSEDKRNDVNTAMLNLSEQLSTLSDSQIEMRSVLKKMLELFSTQLAAEDDKIQIKHLRNIDVQFKYLIEETVKGQNQFNDTLKSEFKLLARTLGAMVDRAPTSPAPERNPAPTANPPQEDILDYDMPTPKPKTNKKPLFTTDKKLTARKDD